MKLATRFFLLICLGSLGCGTDAATFCGEWIPVIDDVRVEGSVACGVTKAGLKADISVGNYHGTCLGDGRFQVPNLLPGTYALLVSSPGYVDHFEEIEIKFGQTTLCSAIHLPKK